MRPRAKPKVVLVLLVCLLTAYGPAVLSSRVRPVNLEQMTERAARIFSGTCVETSVETDPTLGMRVTLATFDVDQVVKGAVGERVTVKFLGGASASGSGFEVAGMPDLQIGEEVVLFLYGESKLGLSSPVGLGQGKFTIHRDKQGRRLAINTFGNKSLFQNLSQGAAKRLDAKGRQSIAESGLEPSKLLDMAKALAR
jgi:hypothetical protein